LDNDSWIILLILTESQGENCRHFATQIGDFRMKCCTLVENAKNNISGRSKRNIPLPVFQNEPKGIIIEYTYKELGYTPYIT